LIDFKMASHATEETYPYRDSSKSIDERVSDLVGRMTLAEKAGQLFHNMLLPGPEGSLAPSEPKFSIEDTKQLMGEKYMGHFNIVGPGPGPRPFNGSRMAEQPPRIALTQTRLGIPITISSDPRHHFNENIETLSAPGQ
jgi:hypothetical protein